MVKIVFFIKRKSSEGQRVVLRDGGRSEAGSARGLVVNFVAGWKRKEESWGTGRRNMLI
jgi:hypothetical protein